MWLKLIKAMQLKTRETNQQQQQVVVIYSGCTFYHRVLPYFNEWDPVCWDNGECEWVSYIFQVMIFKWSTVWVMEIFGRNRKMLLITMHHLNLNFLILSLTLCSLWRSMFLKSGNGICTMIAFAEFSVL